MAVTWLHISDLHVRRDNSYDRAVVFQALVSSVRHFRESDGRCPDLIFATGDIAHSGKPDEYSFAAKFLDELLGASGLERTHLYVVPGNHDVDRTIGNQLTRTLYSRDEADKYFDPGARKLHLIEKLGAFLRWHRIFFDGIRTMPDNSTCGPVELVEVRGHRLGILPINTALFCQDDNDHEQLFVGRRCLSPAIEELDQLSAHLKIALMHHPLHDLSHIERANIKAGLIDHLDVILSGHLHEAGSGTVEMWRGSNLYCAAGATYQTRKWPNTAYYATFDRDHVTIFPTRYEDHPREAWTLDTSLFPDTGYEASFPVPREPDFRSFRTPGSDQYGGNRGKPLISARFPAWSKVIPQVAAFAPTQQDDKHVRQKRNKKRKKGQDQQKGRGKGKS